MLALSTLGAVAAPATALADGPVGGEALSASADTDNSRVRWVRLAGADRYQTARMVVDEEFRKANSVVVASGDNYPDALAASAVAGALGSPVILTPGHALGAEARGKIEGLGATNAVIIGGEAAVGDAVKAELEGMGAKAMRIAGTDRAQTSVAAFRTLRSLDTRSDTVIVAPGHSFADSLAISPWAWSSRTPILLCDADGTLPESAVEAIHGDAGISKVVIVGGEAVVDDYVFEQIGDKYDIRRLGGKTRYETAQLIACFETENGMRWTEPVVATGQNFPDALAGASLAGARKQVMVLVSHSIDDAIRMFRVLGKRPTKAYALGGAQALSDASGMVSASFGLDGTQTAILDAADVVEWPGPALCAQWVADVYREAEAADPLGDARDLYWDYCTSSNLNELRPGMMIAVSTHPHSQSGSIWGHVGLYLGDGLVRQSMGEELETIPLTEWIEHFGHDVTPMWGWPW